MLIQSVLSVVGRGVWRVGAVLLGAGEGCDELIRGGGWCCVGNVGWGVFLMCVILLYTLCHYYSRYNVASIQARVAYECKGSGNLQRV